MIKKFYFFTSLCLLALVFAFDSSLSFADELKKADSFFEEGFVVKKPIKKQEERKDDGFVEMGEDDPTPTPTPTPENENFLKEKKVLYVIALINADNLEHFKKFKEATEDFCLQTELQLKDLYAICHNCDEVKVEEMYVPFHYWILGGYFSLVDEVPSAYKVITTSPSYVVGLEKGEIILEGEGMLEKYVNSKGYYLGDVENQEKLANQNLIKEKILQNIQNKLENLQKGSEKKEDKNSKKDTKKGTKSNDDNNNNIKKDELWF